MSKLKYIIEISDLELKMTPKEDMEHVIMYHCVKAVAALKKDFEYISKEGYE